MQGKCKTSCWIGIDPSVVTDVYTHTYSFIVESSIQFCKLKEKGLEHNELELDLDLAVPTLFF